MACDVAHGKARLQVCEALLTLALKVCLVGGDTLVALCVCGLLGGLLHGLLMALLGIERGLLHEKFIQALALCLRVSADAQQTVQSGAALGNLFCEGRLTGLYRLRWLRGFFAGHRFIQWLFFDRLMCWPTNEVDCHARAVVHRFIFIRSRSQATSNASRAHSIG